MTLQGKCMRQEPRKLPFQLSAAWTVSMMLVNLSTPCLPIIEDISPTFAFPASIFAYGQTSSGKTYTMMGITEYTVADIFDYMHRVIKVSNLELFLFPLCAFFPSFKLLPLYNYFYNYSMKKEHLFWSSQLLRYTMKLLEIFLAQMTPHFDCWMIQRWKCFDPV